MPSVVDVVLAEAASDATAVLAAVARGVAPYVLVHRPGLAVDLGATAALAAAMAGPMAATASPVPVESGPADQLSMVPLDSRLPPAPTLAGPCEVVCLISREALASVRVAADGPDWRTTLAKLGTRLAASGYRHVAAPGATWPWTPPGDHQLGPANEALRTHQLWAETRVRGERLVIDGACLTDDPHNGSQAVVWNVARALKRTRPGASVSIAVHKGHVDHLRELANGSGVEIIARDRRARGFDLAYRPYQPLEPGELDWLTESAERLLTSQLDMIAFSNPAYHPSPALFHAVRNLQRYTMRIADGVTFISEFGRQAALAECPDVEASRTFVVGCGADPVVPATRTPSPDVAARVADGFVACISATFWHKNRRHAIRTFDLLCREHGYEGSLVVAGPEPYYGRSESEDAELLAELDPAIRARVIEVGRVDEPTKWWLLERADVVLYPSIVEGFGLVPFEAAAVGTPALAFAGSALAEVLGGTNAVLPTWDPSEWAAAASRLLKSGERADAALNEVRRVGAAHTWDGTAERTWEAIDSLLARPRANRFIEEGGATSRVAGGVRLATGARAAHFANRVRSYAERRLRG